MAPIQGSDGTQGWNCEAAGQTVTLQLQMATCHQTSRLPEWLLRQGLQRRPENHRHTSNSSMVLKTKTEACYTQESNLSFGMCLSFPGGSTMVQWNTTAGNWESHSEVCSAPIETVITLCLILTWKIGVYVTLPTSSNCWGGWKEVTDCYALYIFF